MERRRVIVLGSTGSIGTQALEVVSKLAQLAPRAGLPFVLDVVGLAAGTRGDVLAQQASRFPRARLALAGGEGAPRGALVGPDAAERLVREVECDVVLTAMVGFAGLPATLAAVELGRDVALANKETLVAAGHLVVSASRRRGARLLPVDSEHSAIWQCLAGRGDGVGPVPPLRLDDSVARVVLTASGGPFRTWSAEAIRDATPAQALAHPTWRMGPKVTIDSASLMNKALELIEAHWLFGVGADRLDALVHPQSIVHGLVEFADGSVVAQMGAPDMRTPIQLALCWPHRPPASGQRLDLASLSRLDFEPPDPGRFPALGLARRIISGETGSGSGAVFNAANEAAVRRFLAPGSTMPFGAIVPSVASALEALSGEDAPTLADVARLDALARAHVEGLLGARAS